MDVENTDLERRVLAHEQILQVSLPTCQKRNRNFWTGYSKYSRNTTHWALASRATPVRPHTQSTLSSGGAPERQSAPQLGLLYLVPARDASISLTTGHYIAWGPRSSAAWFHPKFRLTKSLRVRGTEPS